MRRILAFCLITSAAPAAAEAPFLQLPLDCQLGQSCWVEDYMDADESPRQRDYLCGRRARDGHGGTDFAIIGFDEMAEGVAVLASADGIVAATRDGEKDALYSIDRAAEVKGKECGNAVRIRHDNGYQTLYCHLRQGSVAVRTGQTITAGTVLGLVGLSGRTNYPHVHLAVFKGKQRVDPFAPQLAPGTCNAQPQADLWLDEIAYEKTGLVTAGFALQVPDFAAVKTGAMRVRTIKPDQNMVLYSRFQHAEKGDVLTLWTTGPNGEVFRRSHLIKNPKADMFRAFGRRAPKGGWSTGSYRGHIRLERKGTLIAQRHTHLTVE